MAFAPSMPPAHANIFLQAAKRFNVHILVRRTNAASLDYVGVKGFVPKRLDCKAKTADNDFVAPGHGVKQVAGLVVDPHIAGPSAFNGNKYADALDIWNKSFAQAIKPQVATLEGQRRLTYVPAGGLYFVDLDPESPRYGAVMFASNSLLAAGQYVHGDFDLYGIVPADRPGLNVAVRGPQEERLGQVHARGREFLDVQVFVNSRIGVPMVLHGAQESYATEHSDEGIDIFSPNGLVRGAENRDEIERLYRETFQGRKLFTKKGPVDVVNGLFVTPA